MVVVIGEAVVVVMVFVVSVASLLSCVRRHHSHVGAAGTSRWRRRTAGRSRRRVFPRVQPRRAHVPSTRHGPRYVRFDKRRTNLLRLVQLECHTEHGSNLPERASRCAVCCAVVFALRSCLLSVIPVVGPLLLSLLLRSHVLCKRCGARNEARRRSCVAWYVVRRGHQPAGVLRGTSR